MTLMQMTQLSSLADWGSSACFTLPPTHLHLSDGKKQADVVFLLDGSINFGKDNFQEVINFIYGIIDAIYEDGDSINVALVQYNSDVSDEFFLKDFSKKDDILTAVEKVTYKGGRVADTGAAIKHVQAKHFVKEAGSRADQKVPQIAFIITGGKAEDDAQAASLALARSGVKVFAVGVKNIDLGEVTKLSSDGTTAFRAATAQELSELNEAVLVTLSDTMKEQLCRPVGEVSKGNGCHFKYTWVVSIDFFLSTFHLDALHWCNYCIQLCFCLFLSFDTAFF